ncbi:MAG: phospho-sugar mutase [Phycicoccus sp.]|nr:phospho-sugar mutase [Phycicoccus sp.]NMM32544.1 phospho-sugar mutase [Phycicoccus sp.]
MTAHDAAADPRAQATPPAYVAPLELLQRATSWRDDDPDAATRAELDAVIEAAAAGDAEAGADLADRFVGMLEFGTAGLRGALGAGPNRMNRSVVIRAAAGLTAYLKETEPHPLVVIGFDARHNSDVFAADTAAVVVAAGGRAMVLPRPLPTPLVAFAIRHLGASAGVMVTASHNPSQDNGYKVYLGDGSQIVPPSDAAIAAHISEVELVADVPRASSGWTTLNDDVLEAYLDAAAAVVAPGGARDLRVVHTALHGVGSDVIVAAFARAGFSTPIVVPSQSEPDPEFPTVIFPNPEEPGAIDAALALAAREHADLVLANDPDADRCAVAVPDPAAATPGNPSGWRMLRGDEVGSLLGAHILARGVAADDVFANSIVSSRLLAAMAAGAGIRHEETLTGFKWISRVEGLRYGYEEALGYCVDPQQVRDKDGVSAALLLAEMAAALRAQGRSLLDVLDDLALAHGVHATDSFAVRVDDLSLIGTLMSRLREEPPTDIGGVPVVRIDDLSEGSDQLPPTDGLRYHLKDESRVIVRPSGTEPKLKVYLEVIVAVEPSSGLAAAQAEARGRLDRVSESMQKLTAL